MDVGGSHVTAAVVDPAAPSARPFGREAGVPSTEQGAVIDPHAPRDVLLEQLTGPGRAVAAALDASGAQPLRGWAVAMPGPFDSAAGTGTFAGVDKFAAIAGVDLRGEFAKRLAVAPRDVRFCNDAVAYGIGEWAVGAGHRARRMICITLGTGVGSAFLADGVEVDSGPHVPDHGEVHRLTIDDRPLEETMSSPALRQAFRDRTGRDASVREVCALARAGDTDARDVLRVALSAVGTALAPWVRRFEADTVVVGGSIARSWDVVGVPFRSGLATCGATTSVVAGGLGARAPLVGAAVQWERDARAR